MLRKYKAAIGRLSDEGTSYIRSYFHLRGRRTVYDQLQAMELGQADLVLCLLRGEHISDVERLVGRRIKRLPPDTRLTKRAPRVRAVPRVRWTTDNLRQMCGPRKRRFALVRVGMSREQMLLRGIRPRDIASWLRRGHMEFS